MRGLRIGFGLSLGLFGGLLGLSLGQCSFELKERTLCTSGECTPTEMPDMRPIPPDMAKDPNDPGASGPFGIATFALLAQGGISDQILLAPSDDMTTISTRQQTYPLIVMAPPTQMSVSAMRLYADRLVTHGFIVTIYQASDQSNDQSYRMVGNGHIDAILNSAPANIRDRVDATKVGLLGYQMSAKIAVNIANMRQTPMPNISGLFLIDPTDLLATPSESGSTNIANVRLVNNNTIVMLGEPRSTTGSPQCIQSPQKGYENFWANAPSPSLAISFDGANLGDFVPSFPDFVCTQGSTAPQSQTQNLAVKFATAYFQWILKGSSRAREYLYGNDFSADASTAMLTARMKQ